MLHPASIELRHWQLRNLICVDYTNRDQSTIIFPEISALRRFCLETGDMTTITDLPAAPHCIATSKSKDYILCGGMASSAGQVTFVDVASGSTTAHRVGDELINSVIFDDDELHALACSNDQGVYVASIDRNWCTINRLETGFPVNDADIKGTTMALCGDKNVVQILGGRCANWQHEMNIAAPAGADVGSSVTFSPCGQFLAGAFQKGDTVLWDIRNVQQPLVVLPSVDHARRRTPGAFRVAKFADDVHDLLFVSEEHGCVHMLDIRTFKHSVIKLDRSMTVIPRSHISRLPQELPDTLGLAWSNYEGGALVVGSTDGVHVMPFGKRNGFPGYKWR